MLSQKKNNFLHFPHFVKSLLETPNVDILNRFCDEEQLFIRVLRNCLSLDSSWTLIWHCLLRGNFNNIRSPIQEEFIYATAFCSTCPPWWHSVRFLHVLIRMWLVTTTKFLLEWKMKKYCHTRKHKVSWQP